jgi:hypothetical protein
VHPRFRPVSRAEVWGRAAAFLGIAGVAMGTLIVAPTLPVVGSLLAGEAVLIALLIRRQRRAWRLVRASDDAVSLMQQGRNREAAQLMESLLEPARQAPMLHALILYNRGVLLLHEGEPEGALAMLETVHASGWLAKGEGVYLAHLHQGLAVAWACCGGLEAARHHAELAHRAVGDVRRPSLLPMDVMLLAREGRDADALVLVELYGRQAEPLLQRNQLRSLTVYQAWLTARTRPEGASHPEVARLLASVLPLEPGEMVSTTRHWPELQSFLSAWRAWG